MIEHWQRTKVTGIETQVLENGKKIRREHAEDILHRRGQDPMVMACRRNNRIAGCGMIYTATEEAFTGIREDAPPTRRKADIPRDDRQEEWDW